MKKNVALFLLVSLVFIVSFVFAEEEVDIEEKLDRIEDAGEQAEDMKKAQEGINESKDQEGMDRRASPPVASY